MNNFLRWLVISSQNPDKVSATFKGVLLQYLALLMALGSIIHLPFTQDAAYQVITDIAGLVGTLLGVFGLIRKIYYEIVGKPEPIIPEQPEN